MAKAAKKAKRKKLAETRWGVIRGFHNTDAEELHCVCDSRRYAREVKSKMLWPDFHRVARVRITEL